MSAADEIKKLAELREAGHLTEDEFNIAKKNQLGFSEDETQLLARDVEFYAASVNAWLAYRQEGNKQLLLMSAGALALLVGLTTGGDKAIKSFELDVWLLISCALAFFVCLTSSLLEIKNSPLYLEALVKEEPSGHIEYKLRLLEKISSFSFWLGAIGLFSLVFYRLF